MQTAPTQVITHHLEALEQGDLENIMTDYAEDAVMMFPDHSLRGKKAIRDFFAGAIKQYGAQALAGVKPLRQDHEGEIVYVNWVQHPDTQNTTYGCDTYLVQNGQIVVQAVYDA